MSYALRLVNDARDAISVLPPAVQEEAYDILERTADEADSLDPDAVGLQHLLYRTDDEVVYLQLYCTAMHDERTLVLDRVIAVTLGKRGKLQPPVPVEN